MSIELKNILSEDSANAELNMSLVNAIQQVKFLSDTDTLKIFTSKLRMLNFEIPLLNLPDSCEQCTTIKFIKEYFTRFLEAFEGIPNFKILYRKVYLYRRLIQGSEHLEN